MMKKNYVNIDMKNDKYWRREGYDNDCGND